MGAWHIVPNINYILEEGTDRVHVGKILLKLALNFHLRVSCTPTEGLICKTTMLLLGCETVSQRIKTEYG
jgi:hypothetical protein